MTRLVTLDLRSGYRNEQWNFVADLLPDAVCLRRPSVSQDAENQILESVEPVRFNVDTSAADGLARFLVQMLQFIANGLCNGASYALVAVGFGLIYTTTGVFHIAHGAVYTLGAYTLYCFFVVLKLPLVLAIAIALSSAAVAGALIELVVYRPLNRKRASTAVLMVSSLGVYIVLVNAIAMFLGNETKILRPGVDATFTLGDVILTRIQVAQLVVSSAVIGFYWFFLSRSSLGRLCRAVADDSALASVLGVKVEGTRLVAFAVGSSLATVGSILIALDVGVDPKASAHVPTGA